MAPRPAIEFLSEQVRRVGVATGTKHESSDTLDERNGGGSDEGADPGDRVERAVVTSKAAISLRMLHVYAAVYRPMKPGSTRCTVSDPGSCETWETSGIATARAVPGDLLTVRLVRGSDDDLREHGEQRSGRCRKEPVVRLSRTARRLSGDVTW
jgi:hypothetical protein